MLDSAFSENRSLTISLSSPEWDGARSQKFKKGKRIFTTKDLIQDCIPIILSRDQYAHSNHLNWKTSLCKLVQSLIPIQKTKTVGQLESALASKRKSD